MEDLHSAPHDKRKTWEEPTIVLERALEATAQRTGPTGPASRRSGKTRGGFLAPLALSATGLCF